MTVQQPPDTATKTARPISLDDRYTLDSGRVLLSGTQALVRMALMQRQRDVANGLNTAGYVSGYRGSPLAGLDREFGRAGKLLKANHIVFHPGVNEDLAATAVWGTQQLGLFPGARYDGVFGMWYGKGPGVDRSIDVIRHANAEGTGRHGGVLLLAGDDHGAVSSTLPHQSEHNLISAMVPMLSPAGIGEFLDYGLMGWAMSRVSGAWVGFKCQTDIVEATASVDIDPHRLTIVTPDMALPADGVSARWPDGPHAKERRLIDVKLAMVQAFARANRIDHPVMDNSRARLGIVASGKAWLDLMGALDLLGIDEARASELGIKLYKVGLVWPLEPMGLTSFSDGLETLLVVEEKRGVIEDQIKSVLFNLPDSRRPRVVGKTDLNGADLLPAWGELDPVAVARAILRHVATQDGALAERSNRMEAIVASAPRDAAPVSREAYFCSGCPHSISTRVPDGSRASTGIGCHMMIVGNEDRHTSTFTQMGGEGVAWTGMAHFTDENHIFVNMGDGTYFHSGLLAIRAAIASHVNATYKILYNDAVAMTGGQPHDGVLTVPMIVDQVRAEGAARIAVVAEQPDRWIGVLPRDIILKGRDELDAVQRDLRDIPGITVLIFDQVCAAEKRRRRKRGRFPVGPKRAVINELVCEGCGDCSAVSNCISIEPVETAFGRKRAINQSSCNTDLSCIKGFCPSFVTVEGGKLKRGKAVASAEDRFAGLPLPALPALDRPYNMLMAGIGGTGVITVSAIVAQAAHLDGRGVLVLDQTGLAQKNGAVVSHMRLASSPDLLSTIRISVGEADLIIGFDMVVTAGSATLAAARPDRTAIVVDSHLAPTASFVRNTTIDFRASTMLRSIAKAGGTRTLTIDATTLATSLMGDAIAGNMFQLGYAWQNGLVPVGHEALMTAIELNGTAVGMNKAAFNWGRLAAHDIEAVRAAAGGKDTTEPKAETLDEIIARRIAFLTDYQDAAYAARYRSAVAHVRAAESLRTPGEASLSEAVAKSLFKLMAYKDEYEVARLHADTSFAKKLADTFEGPVRLQYHLAPPMLTRIDARTGAPAKIAFGAWMLPVFRVLAKFKRLRGTAFDPFGRTEERRMERRLIGEYVGMMQELSARLTPANHEVAVELARIPEEIRGYGHVKLKSVAAAEAKRSALLARLDVPAMAAE